MIVVIDNYDSFTYNLVHYVGEFEEKVKVIKNDEMSVDDVMALIPKKIIIILLIMYIMIYAYYKYLENMYFWNHTNTCY